MAGLVGFVGWIIRRRSGWLWGLANEIEYEVVLYLEGMERSGRRGRNGGRW